MKHPLRLVGASTAAALAVLAAGCGGGSNGDGLNAKPSYVGDVGITEYDGTTDDLLTAGLGQSGLAGVLPDPADPASPTPAELRRAAIYNNYRAMLDMTAAGGYGSLYGPRLDAQGNDTGGEGRIAGSEFIAYSDDGTGRENVTLMVQLPASFDPEHPCIVTATSSGSRGIYGAISTGEWGLKRGCAVAYTDKGTGGAPHDLAADTVPLIDGTRASAADAGDDAAFNAGLSDAELAAFNTATPNRLAFKHAHSQRNPEKDWGRYTLQAVEFALYVINERHGEVDERGRRERSFKASNTLVIASSISNGGGAAIAAAEQDTRGLIDGVAVAEPAVELPTTPGVQVQRGAAVVPTAGKPLIDFTTYANLFQPCAALSTQLAGTPFQAAYAAGFGFVAGNRCASLRAKGLLSADTTVAQADEALQKLRDYGWEADSDALQASHIAFEIAPAVSITFANALARASVKDHLCGYSYAAATGAGAVTAMDTTQLAQMFATGNGVPPQAAPNVQLINNLNPAGPVRDLLSFSPSTSAMDWNVDGALCLRNLLAGTDAAARALQAGLDETRRNGNLRGKPAVIVHGRNDALLPVNHTSRPYYALNKTVEGNASRLSYLEVENAQHFDGFIGLPAVLPGYDTRYVPLHVYLNRALDAVYAHLRDGTALPPSQVVRTTPRGGTPGAAPAITAANVPPPSAAPAAGDRITMSGTTVQVPD
ncbi:D-(-)-3-hydroxybutyrate oligomer hydrolase [Schlegelella sp. S2-27]|uniref:D-(-)-3-hydroxybutyrate oligomer hydrolase n=1 Tax=Caldimonas mangrovi TaxID=2944811 RepID=A0ABT0YPT9_9BURK|nr:D-(-)-3-hydroxybutyrate oligomer hydrolase [Caldimonas mangrovi]MCM5680683.1 D-(-)-3-hydroxybutyrate oligomer hydrolase [Caldimonas mangrovi]